MDLFVYGTLQRPELMAAVSGRVTPPYSPGRLNGYKVATLEGDVVPAIAADPSASCEGMLFKDLSDAEIARLDLFEGAFGYVREQVQVETSKGLELAEVYLPPAGGTAGGVPWDVSEWANDHLEPMLLAVEELFSHDPLPNQKDLRRMWPVVEKRAWAHLRASKAATPPATRRYAPVDDDVRIETLEPPHGTFFKMRAFGVDHRRFDGARSGRLQREVFLGIDAVLVLPYDPETGHIMLVEQARMGLIMRGDHNPWTLEPIAGMTDAREAPEEAAMREAAEETGLEIETLVHMFSMYPSPGSSTDYFVCYCAPIPLPSQETYTGGLDEEAEDLRIHVIPLEAALEMIATGEINAGPLVAMLYWLNAHKDTLALRG